MRESYLETILEASESEKNMLLSWATGVGKSLAAISIQNKMDAQSTLICVAETAHINNWIAEYKKHGFEHLLATTTIICYSSLHKYQHSSFDLLINDECHHITELRASYFDTIKAKKIVNLSATVHFGEKISLASLWGPLYEHIVTLNEAIAVGIVPPPTIYLIPMELQNIERDCTINFPRTKEPTSEVECIYPQRKNFIFGAEYKKSLIKIKATQRELYTFYTDQMAYYKDRYLTNHAMFDQINWLRHGSERKRALANMKYEAIQKVVELVNKRRYICFCGSINQAEKLGTNNVLHSKLTKKQQEGVITKFQEGQFNSLFAVDMLKEGVNLKDIEVGIIAQLDGKERSFIQKMGRALRNPVNPEVYIIYFKETQDEEYLKNVLAEVNPDYVKVLNIWE